MKKYKVRARVSFYTDVVVKAENKLSAYELVEGVLSFGTLVDGRSDGLEDEVTDILVKGIKKNEQRTPQTTEFCIC